jgi:integrase/recombinase XerD
VFPTCIRGSVVTRLFGIQLAKKGNAYAPSPRQKVHTAGATIFRSGWQFRSPFGSLMEQFVREKRACGYRYDEPARLLARFDRFLCDEALSRCELPRSISRKWLAKQPHESGATHYHRICAVRHFAIYLCRLGYPADVPDRSLTAKRAECFSPRILTHAEIQQLFQAVDQLTPTARSPLRHLIMPKVFRLLYGCGFRLGEVLHLRVADVDLDRGVLTVREAKFRKDRLVPPALPLVQRLRAYAEVPRRQNRYCDPSQAFCSLGSKHLPDLITPKAT